LPHTTDKCTAVRQSRVKQLRSKTYHGSDDEWVQILTHVLGLDPPRTSHADWVSGIEVNSLIHDSGNDHREMVISWRMRIDGITQRLGSITLPQNDDETIQLFEWAGEATTRADELEHQASSLIGRFSTAEDTINKLNRQLEELINAKNEHESQLISNFVQLLNEKKLKIRNQQRLLASARVDPSRVSALESATSDRGLRRAEASRPSKRKMASDSDSETDEGFENMDVDQGNIEDNDDEATDPRRQETPQPLEDETESEEDEDVEFDFPSSHGKEDGVAPSNRPGLATPSSPPPRRDLPFTRGETNKNPTKLPMDGESHPPLGDPENENTGESDDDEL
ncbi:hypothetical protein V8E54_007254, partial [Elaphomyces granulatus]